MGLWGGIKSVGRGIGRGIGKVGKKVGQEIVQGFDPIVKGVKGDWKGALAGIGHNIKRGAQIGAVLGTGGVAGVGLGTMGAAGGAIEGGFKEGGGGFKDIAGGAMGGYGGVQTGKALGNLGRGIAGKVGERGAVEAASGGAGGMSRQTLEAQRLGQTLDKSGLAGQVIPIPDASLTPDVISTSKSLANLGNAVTTPPPDPSMWSKGLDYARSQATPDMAMKMASQFMGGGQGGGDGYDMTVEEQQAAYEQEQREQFRRSVMMGGYKSPSRWA